MATQKDIAKALGLSIGLVSRALSGKAREIGIPEATIIRVQDEAKRVNYVPNSAARNLKGVKTRTLGVVTYDFEDPYLGVILGQLQKIAHEKNYSLILTGSYRRQPDSIDISPFIKHAIEGLIIVGSDRGKEWHKPLKSKNLPTVQIGFSNKPVGTLISLDENKCAATAVSYFKKLRLKKAALLHNDTFSHQVYKNAYRQELSKQDLEICGEFQTDNEASTLEQQVTAILNSQADILICGDDLLALKAIRALHEAGANVPRDLLVIGLDDVTFAADAIPSLTSLRPPLEKMLTTAFSMACGESALLPSVKFTPELISRESC